MELLPACVLGTRQTTPSDWAAPTASELAGPLPWYKTVVGGADSTEEAPGALCVAGTGTDTVIIEQRGVFQFKTSASTSNTPAAVALREQARKQMVEVAVRRERLAILKVLGMSPTAVEAAKGPTS